MQPNRDLRAATRLPQVWANIALKIMKTSQREQRHVESVTQGLVTQEHVDFLSFASEGKLTARAKELHSVSQTETVD